MTTDENIDGYSDDDEREQDRDRACDDRPDT
jgi:hypothetical protein